MPKFYREAIFAAHRMIDPAHAAQIGSLETWPEVAEALNGLPPTGQCHAIYADWLLQLHEPGGDVQIQIRDLLLGQGALAANYLGEMAQNADDSGATSLLVALDGNWLLVANNSRPLSSLNLLGLCRFFVHSNGQVVGLTPETIGRFGIRYKSCHSSINYPLQHCHNNHENDRQINIKTIQGKLYFKSVELHSNKKRVPHQTVS